jgi:hypothetical protein
MPDRFWFLPIDRSTVRIASFYGLMESTSAAAPISAPMTIDSWLAAADGDPSGFWLMSLVGKMAFPDSFVWGEMAAVSRADTLAAKRYFAAGAHGNDANLGRAGTEFLYGGGGLVDAWPSTPGENEYTRVRDSNVETLLVGGTLDFATPAVNATRELLPHLPNGHQVVLRELGHTTSFWNYEPKASTRLLNAFLGQGRVDTSLYTPARVEFTPDVSQPALAKGIAGMMLGFAALAALSLLLMWVRVHRRGGFGRKASIVLRSFYTVVLGLGGWFAGLTVVLVAFPTVPLDDVVLAVVSVGMPIGLGTFWAWVNRSLSTGARAAGLAGALGGALLGGWAGFHASTGLAAVLTTIAGAAAGANLVLLVLDIRRDRTPESVEEARPVPVPAGA